MRKSFCQQKKSEICHQELQLLTFSRARRKPITFGNAVNKSCRQIQPEALHSISGLHVVPFYSISAKKSAPKWGSKINPKKATLFECICRLIHHHCVIAT